MEQRIYHGPLSPEGLAEFLVQHYEPQHDLQAQQIGQGNALAVQIGRGDVPEKLRHAVTVGVARDEDEQGVVVTLGEQQWITPQMATYAAMIGIVSLIVTPWALFALLWPVSELVGSSTLPEDVWHVVETYAIGHGAVLVRTHELSHPHTG